MKFWQRFLILGSASFLVGTIYYYSLLDDTVTSNLQEQRRALEEARLGASPLQKTVDSFSLKLDPEVCSLSQAGTGPGGERRGVIGSRSSGNVSTVELFHEAHFNVLADGMYELPSAPSEFPGGGRNSAAAGSRAGGLETLNVILMPHSHVDPGWHKTTSEYYTDQTKHILTHMVNKLTEHPDMTFVWAETIYFAMWWNELEDAVKVHVRRLIRRGQLEVVLGGWVMPDEASSHYVAVIDQLLEGHQWLWENLGVKPANSWSIDPFGYSGAMPYLWKLAGMDNMVIQRVHQAVKASLMRERSLEFLWRQFWDPATTTTAAAAAGAAGAGGGGGGEGGGGGVGGSTDILCHVMPYMLYSIKFSCGPNRFVCKLYDFLQEPGGVARGITEDNVQKLAEPLYRQFRQKAYFYRYNTVLVPLGDDFRYYKLDEWDHQHGNYSRLMRYMNARPDWKVHVRFGTLADYFRLVRQEQRRQRLAGEPRPDFPVLSGDFFPYSDKNLDYWTGYFTTRPFDKRFQREVQSMIQAADITVTLTYALLKRWGRQVQENFFHLASLMQSAHRAQGQFLHHDAITGTSKDFVVADYEARLQGAYSATQSVMKMALQALLTEGKKQTPYVFHPETVRDQHDEPPERVRLPVTEGGLLVLVFNSLPQYRQQPVRVLVDTDWLRIKNHQGKTIPCQINPVWGEEKGAAVRPSVYEVVFVAELPPLATLPFTFLRESRRPETAWPARLSAFGSPELGVPPPGTSFQHDRQEPVSVQNDKVRVRVDPRSGRLMDVEDLTTGNVTVVDMGLEVYRSQSSGAYLFRPAGGTKPLITAVPVVRVVEGSVASEVIVSYPPFLTQTFTLYHHPALLASGVHVRNDLDIRSLRDREVVLRMKTDLRMKTAHFFSDQNGMQFIRRRINENAGVEANFYPLTSGAFLEEDGGGRRVSLLSAQPHGAASLQPGWLEVMLDRHLLRDDERGLGEGVHDVKPVTSEFVLLVETRSAPRPPGRGSGASPDTAFPSLLSLSLGDRLQQPPQVYYSDVSSPAFSSPFRPLKTALPCDLALLSLRSLATGNLNYNGTSLILHRRAYDCGYPAGDLQCGLPGAAPAFGELFEGLGLSSVRETSLTHLHHKRSVDVRERLRLRPMQIAAYHLTF